jgi:hypothetical protein
VLGQLTAGLLRVLAFVVQLIGFSAEQAGKAIKDVYDMVVFLPLKVEELIVDSRARVRVESAADRTEVVR